jgi:hypothetical protein
MSNGGNVLYRTATPEDVPFVMDSWMKSWRKSPWAGCIPNNRYYDVTRDGIEQLIARGATLEIACNPTNPKQIFGWVCRELTTDDPAVCVIHYCYVKDPFLRMGVGETLVARSPGRQPGYYTYAYRQVKDSCGREWKHAPEISRRARKESEGSDPARAHSDPPTRGGESDLGGREG